MREEITIYVSPIPWVIKNVCLIVGIAIAHRIIKKVRGINDGL